MNEAGGTGRKINTTDDALRIIMGAITHQAGSGLLTVAGAALELRGLLRSPTSQLSSEILSKPHWHLLLAVATIRSQCPYVNLH
jgi:hypothetical protein